MQQKNSPHFAQGAVRAADAQFAFVIAAARTLPPPAFPDLFRRRSVAGIAKWAVQWRVDAKCMVAYATALKAARLTRSEREGLVQGRLRLDVAPGAALPTDIRQALSSIDHLTLIPLELVSAVRALDQLPRSMTRETLRDRVADSYMETYRQRELLKDTTILAAVAADPIRETRKHFLTRAEEHYSARALHLSKAAAAARFPIGRSKPAPELAKHVAWLVRFQIGEESFDAIASDANGERERTTAEAVRVAVQRLARIVGLDLRPSSLPRSRSNPNT